MKAELIWRSEQKSTENKRRHYMEMTAKSIVDNSRYQMRIRVGDENQTLFTNERRHYIEMIAEDTTQKLKYLSFGDKRRKDIMR